MASNRLTPEYLDRITKLYQELGNVWKVAEQVGRCGQSIHEVLQRRGIIKPINIFTKEDDQYLVGNYNKYVDDGKLNQLAEQMGRTKNFLCRQAKRLGLTDHSRKQHPDVVKAKGDRTRENWKLNGHPRGMLGKKHSQKVCSDMSKRFKAAWADPNSKYNSEETRQQRSDAMSERQANNPNKSNNYSRTKKGWFLKNGIALPMRSSWEFNYAHYLNHLENEGKITKWEYEVDRFKFEEIKVSPRTYTPDFKIIMPNGNIIYHEVKGWMDEKSKLKLKYMKKYYPYIRIKLIDKKRYTAIEKTRDTIPNWGIWLTEKPC